MSRVAEHIEHHARRLKHRARAHAQRIPRAAWIMLGLSLAIVVALVLILMLLFQQEKKLVLQQDVAMPLACRGLWFSQNGGLCEKMLLDAYNTMPALARKPICDRTKDRTRFGAAASACSAYDEALSVQLYAPLLREYGISPWEPDENITVNGRLLVRSLSAINSGYLVCNKELLDTAWQRTNEANVYEVQFAKPVTGTCVLIARTNDGSVTSKEFRLKNE